MSNVNPSNPIAVLSEALVPAALFMRSLAVAVTKTYADAQAADPTPVTPGPTDEECQRHMDQAMSRMTPGESNFRRGLELIKLSLEAKRLRQPPPESSTN